MSDDNSQTEAEVPRKRLAIGTTVFVVGQLIPLTIPLVAMSSLSDGWKTTLSGFLLLGVPELATVLAVIILGKAGFKALKSRMFGFIKKSVFTEQVSPPRYYVGLVLFFLPLAFGWVWPYLLEGFPVLIDYRLTMAIVGDVSMIIGLFVLGGHFWDKLRSLFFRDSHAVFDAEAQTN